MPCIRVPSQIQNVIRDRWCRKCTENRIKNEHPHATDPQVHRHRTSGDARYVFLPRHNTQRLNEQSHYPRIGSPSSTHHRVSLSQNSLSMNNFTYEAIDPLVDRLGEIGKCASNFHWNGRNCLGRYGAGWTDTARDGQSP